jgi:hypothetical protein
VHGQKLLGRIYATVPARPSTTAFSARWQAAGSGGRTKHRKQRTASSEESPIRGGPTGVLRLQGVDRTPDHKIDVLAMLRTNGPIV